MRKLLKWLGIILLVVVVFAGLTAGYLINKSNKELKTTYEVDPISIPIPTDSASIANGKRWTLILCMECHGENLGGKVFFDDPDIGTIYSSNLTRGKGGVGADYEDKDWIRAIKQGVSKSGKGLFIMPSKDFAFMDNKNLGEIIAYLKNMEPKDWKKKENVIKPMTKILMAAGAFGVVFSAAEIDHKKDYALSPVVAPDVTYGDYLVKVFGCRTCHAEGLNGGKSPDPNSPYVPNITSGGNIGKWNLGQFKTVLISGKTPEGKQLDAKFMPWPGTANMNDTELEAIYRYLKSIPSLPDGKK